MQSGVVTYLLALTVTFLYRSVAGELIITPRNTETKVGETTYLNCSTNETEQIFWYHGEASIYHANYKIFEPYIGRFEIDRNASNGSHNLVIYSVQPSDAGQYICVDKDGLGGKQSAELVVLENDPDCHSDMQPDGIIGQNVFGIPPDEAHLTCNVSYHGNIPPLMVWKKVGGYSSVKDTVTSNNISNNHCRPIYTSKIKGDFILDNSSYVCETTRSTQNQYQCTSETIKVLYFVDGDTKEQNVVRGDRIICIVSNSTFSCTTQWYHDDYVCPFPCDEAITAHLLGVYTCTVKCHIRGKDYYTDALKVSVAEVTTSKSLSTSGISLPAVVVSIVVIVIVLSVVSIVIFIVLKRRKMKKSDLPENTIKKPANTIKTQIAEANDRSIKGIAVLNNELFIISQLESEVEVYDCTTLTIRRTWQLNDLIDPDDATSCVRNRCIYISDNKAEGKEIFRIDVDGNIISRWSIGDESGRLSVTNEKNVILSLHDSSKLVEYSPEGKLIREVQLSSGLTHPMHAVKLDNGNFVMTQGYLEDTKHRVCEVSSDGKYVRSFGDDKGYGKKNLTNPTYLAVDREGSIMVADAGNGRVLLIGSNFQVKRVIIPKKCGVYVPTRICLDDINGRLYVIEYKRDMWSLLVFDIR